MKNIKLTSTLISLFAAATTLTPLQASAAGSAYFVLSPNAATVGAGANFAVSIYENGADVNVATANLHYNSDALTCLNVDANRSAFNNGIGSGCSNGNISVSRYVNPGSPNLNGTQLVAVINFRALQSSGTTPVTFVSDSRIASNGQDIWNGDTTGGNYTFVAGGRGGTAPAAPKPKVLAAATPAPTPAPVAATPAPTPVKITPTSEPIKVTPVVKHSNTARNVFSIVALLAIVLGAIAIANRETLAPKANALKDKIKSRFGSTAAPVAAAVAATKASTSKKATLAKKKTTAKKSK